MKVYPTEIADAICPYCGINKCDPQLTHVQEMYRIISISNGKIKYIAAYVKVPKCRACECNSRSSILFPIALFSIFATINFFSLLCGGLTFWLFLGSMLGAIAVSLICWYISSLGVRVVYKIRGLRSYKPIRIMRKYGWRKSLPKKTSRLWSAYTEEKHNKMLMEIVQNGEFMIQKLELQPKNRYIESL